MLRPLAGISGAILLFLSSYSVAADDARLARLEVGVNAAEAVRAVKRLQNSYSHSLEAGRWNDIGDLFTSDATGQFGTEHVQGKSRLRAHFMHEAGRTREGLAAGQLNVHLLLQPIVTLSADGKTARATWHEIAMLGQYGKSASWSGGIYENEYRLDRGVWKISRLAYVPQYHGAYDDWGHQAPAKWDVPYHFEAAHVGVTIPRELLESASSSQAKPARLADLAARVSRLNDETEVRNLQHSFGYYLDRKMWDDVADLFTQDGVLELANRGGYVGPARIHRALEVFYGASPLQKGELFDHIQLGTVVTVSGDHARARTLQLSMLGVNGEYARWEQGAYENEFVKENGTWQLSVVRYFPRMAADYDAGWARSAIPAPGVSTEFPPDRSYPVTKKPARVPSGSSTVNLEDVERALDREIAVDAVENLNSSYGYYIDESAWDNMADTFAKDGSKEITGAGVYVGPDRIRKVLNLRGPRGGRNPKFFTIHQLTQPVIHISPDGQHANARFRLFQDGGNADGSSGSWIGGIYENTASKENGEWKFGRQELYHAFNASYRNGWARVGDVTKLKAPTSEKSVERDGRGGGITQGLGGAASASRFASEFPPDRPITVRQYAFPEIVEPPFHYRNPVSGRAPPELVP